MNKEPTYRQINKQRESGVDEPAILVPTQGRVVAGRLLERDERLYAVYKNETGELRYKEARQEAFSDEVQEHYANILAESIDRSSEELERNVDAKRVLGAVALGVIERDVEKKRLNLRPEDMRAAEEIISGMLDTKDNAISRELGHHGETASDIRGLIDPNDGDEQIRDSVLSAIDIEIDRLAQANMLPERVQRNGRNNMKKPDRRYNYDASQYTSREYSARIALAMLDGSFNYASSEDSRYDDLPRDDPRNGQHRQAAEMVVAVQTAAEAGHIDADRSQTSGIDGMVGYLKSLENLEISGDIAQALTYLDSVKLQVTEGQIDPSYLGQTVLRLAGNLDDIVDKISTSLNSLYEVVRRDELSAVDRRTLDGVDTELRGILFMTDSVRQDNPVYSKLMHCAYSYDEMNLVALKGYIYNGSVDSLYQDLSSVRYRIESLGK